jgi:acetyltransferase-like isoleucine patch superfamily enzyme
MNGEVAEYRRDSDEVAAAMLNPEANRAARKYSWSEQCRRVLWMFGQYAIRLSPRPCFAWRRMVLRLFGAKVGRSVHLYSSTRSYMPWNVEIGDWAALGEDAFIYSLGKSISAPVRRWLIARTFAPAPMTSPIRRCHC